MQAIGDYDHVLAIARAGRLRGAVAIALADHYLYARPGGDETTPAHDSFVQAAALGRDTTEIEIVMLVSPVTFRHPAFYAKAAVTIDELAGGRFVLGLGTGWMDEEHERFGIPYPDRGERFGMLEDALGYLRQFFDDPGRGFSSSRYAFAPGEYRPRARPDLRLLVGGSGPRRTPRLAGQYAGELSIAGTEPEHVPPRIERARAAAAAVGRDPDALLISATSVVVGGDSDAEITENLGRADLFGRPASEARRAWEERGLTLRTWEEYRDRFGRYAEAGIERIYIQLATQDVELTEETLLRLG